MTGVNGNGLRRPAGSVVIAAIVALAALATAAVLFIQGNAAAERLGLLFAILSPTIVGLVAMLRSDTAAARLDSTLDDRIAANVHRVVGGKGPIPPKSPEIPATPLELEK